MKTTKVENAIKGLENAPKTYNELATELQTAPVKNVSGIEAAFTDRLALAQEELDRNQSATASEQQAMTEIGVIMDKLNAVPWNKLKAVEPWTPEEGTHVVEIQAVKPYHNRKRGIDQIIVELKIEDATAERLYLHTMWLDMDNDQITYTLSKLLLMGFVQGSPTAFQDMVGEMIKIDVRINKTENGVYTNTYVRAMDK